MRNSSLFTFIATGVPKKGDILRSNGLIVRRFLLIIETGDVKRWKKLP